MTEPERTGETTWIVTLEEDPETGELIMPLPLEALQAQGWDIGDLLTWSVDENGDLILSKSHDQDEPKP
jgi:hypothetical protein